MSLSIRTATLSDLDIVTEIEAKCFPKSEAATKEIFRQRIITFPNSFLIAFEDNNPIGFINGCITNSFFILDEMFENVNYHNPNGTYQAVFGLDVIPEKRRCGIAAFLMSTMIENSKKFGRTGMILTCKKELIHYYEKFGYKNLGVSKSVHGGAVWYDMILDF